MYSGARADVAIGDTVLVVEDNDDVRESIADVLREEGYRVFTAAHGAEAIDIVKANRPRVVALDLRMPVMDGVAFATWLRGEYPHMPIIIISASDRISIMPKPFDMTKFLREVERQCR